MKINSTIELELPMLDDQQKQFLIDYLADLLAREWIAEHYQDETPIRG
jgi:hypothetical protein